MKSHAEPAVLTSSAESTETRGLPTALVHRDHDEPGAGPQPAELLTGSSLRGCEEIGAEDDP
jgi:hypothetical protein